ncbi:MAG: tripartite tricarboxylate transporter substrate binding protein [Christensenellaceae bacterium]|mgnify:CR=1 FL=1|nr:tripartite tricarboxylate transporter substrate binding protein [Christensenellaceae bacterium]
MRKSLALLLVVLLLLSQVAMAETVTADREWLKGNTIFIVVPFKAGGSLDLMVRTFLPYWEETSGATFVVDNREGAYTQIGTTLFFTMKQDMQNLYAGTQTFLSGNIINGASYSIDDFALINMQQMDPTTLTVLKSSPYTTIQELLDGMKANPGKIKCGMTAGGAGEILLSILEKEYGLDFKIITYDSGNDFRTALLGGHVDFITGSANGDLGLGDEGRPLVVCGSERNQIWPDTPCTEEIWPELNIPSSFGSCRFIGTSAVAAKDYPERFQALVETYEEAFNNPDYQKVLETNGQLYVSAYYGPEESDRLNLTLHELVEANKDVLMDN